jgi:hypothetical protein
MLANAIKAGDWVVADRCRERLVKLFVDAHRVDDVAAVSEVERHFARGHALMIHLYGVSGSLDKAARSWMMSAEARIASIAKLRGGAVRRELDQVALSKRDAIIVALDLVSGAENRKQMTNRELALACSAAEATVARIMPILRTEGLVATVQRGAKRLNELTSAGRNEAFRIHSRAKTPKQANTESLEKFISHEGVRKATVNVDPAPIPELRIQIRVDPTKKQWPVSSEDLITLEYVQPSRVNTGSRDRSNEIFSKLNDESFAISQ